MVFFHIEMIYTNSGPAIVEVNGRLGGRTIPVLYELATGNSMFEHLINISQRAEPKAESVYQGKKRFRFSLKRNNTVKYWTVHPERYHKISQVIFNLLNL
ncbi:hypothetical protein KYT91_07135 [Klebsiella pneumoniae]|nr:hypothetical protein KYT91_07135 [Klebsiella pneumoniae]